MRRRRAALLVATGGDERAHDDVRRRQQLRVRCVPPFERLRFHEHEVAHEGRLNTRSRAARCQRSVTTREGLPAARYTSASFHSSGENPTNTVSPRTSTGRLTSLPSAASRRTRSASLAASTLALPSAR